MEQGQRLEILQKRKMHCCCKYCGHELEIRRMVFSEDDNARVELYCPSCEKIEFGVEKEIYAAAEYFVEELEFQCYFDIPNPLLQKQMNIAKAAEIMAWGFQTLGYLDENGFNTPVKTPDYLLHEHLQLRASELADLLEEASHGSED